MDGDCVVWQSELMVQSIALRHSLLKLLIFLVVVPLFPPRSPPGDAICCGRWQALARPRPLCCGRNPAQSGEEDLRPQRPHRSSP